MGGDPVGLLEPGPVADAGQNSDLGPGEWPDLAVRLLDGDVDVGVTEHHQGVMVVFAQPWSQRLDILPAGCPIKLQHCAFSLGGREMTGDGVDHSFDRPGLSWPTTNLATLGVVSRIMSSPITGVRHTRASRCQR